MAQKRSKLVTQPIFEIEISLADIQPRIWRRIAISGNSRLSTLHRAIQATMSWEDYHLYEFIIDGQRYGQTDYAADPELEQEAQDSQEFQIRKLLKKGSCCQYVYDFGDNWEHEIAVLSIKAPETDVQYPLCLAGERACPPEDVGGIWGYQGFLEAVLDPQHEEHDRMLEWIGGKFDPKIFDLNEANKRLRRIR